MKLGARILKTGIAIVLSLLLANLLHLPSPVFAGIAAIFAIQPTIYRSYLSILEQIQGNIIGAVIAVIFVLSFGNHIFIIGLAAVIVISINLKLKIDKSISLSLVTLIVIMETPSDTFIQFALIRFLTIMLGILSAFIVNLVFLPPKYENRLYNRISEMTSDITKWIRLTTRHASEHSIMRNEIDSLKESMMKLDQLYLMYKEERNYLKHNTLLKSRKLVVYRQMIFTNKRALDTLRRLHRYENELYQFPADLQQFLQNDLDYLIQYHEKTMLKYIGKIKTHPSVDEELISFNRKDLMNHLIGNRSQFDDLSFFHAMQMIATIIDYGEQIDHLDKLISSFHSYHQEGVTLPSEEVRED